MQSSRYLRHGSGRNFPARKQSRIRNISSDAAPSSVRKGTSADAPPESEPCDFRSFQQLHRSIWHTVGPKRETHGIESKRRLNAISNSISSRVVDVPRARRVKQLDDGCNEWGWKKGLHDVRTGNWHYPSGSAAPTSSLMECRTAEEARAIWEQQDPETAKKTWAKLAELYDALRDAQINLSSYTLMHIASKLSKDPTLKRMALEVMALGLSRIEEDPGADLELVRRRSGHLPDEIWDFAIKNGITPNTIQLTALVQSLCAMGQIEAAWQAFDMFHQRGMSVDLKLSSTLLQGSKLAGSVPHIVRAISLIAETQNIDARVGNNILHLVLSLALSDTSQPFLTSFPFMLRIYSRIFSPEPLNAIIPEKLREVVRYDDELEDMILHPEFTSSLDLLFPPEGVTSLEPTPPRAQRLYGHYRNMLQDRHPVAAEIVKTRNSVIHDMIIKAMSSSPAHLRAALEVISDMIRDSAAHDAEGNAIPSPRPATPSTTSSNDANGNATSPDLAQPVHPRPSTWTWNILLDAWMRHYRQDNVGRIVSLMRRHGVEPSLVTWNTILSRAAQARNTRLAVRSAQKIREAGFEPNEWTVRAFSRLVEKEMFLSEMGEGSGSGKGGRGRAQGRGRGQEGEDRDDEFDGRGLELEKGFENLGSIP
ncbi:unnamed protein product [Parascedosporium putredinis]|uniref:Pentatricopeptide repeat protein n=1 Tax=Parascedosporium putredinis TaxID=1442378 RepID=A0A9P1GXR8_9PEZI|nr:unnamed protein product [Parascedosporium putredinis]CAI7990071.1 unnamed protein product [Parascedosporium putredinis]